MNAEDSFGVIDIYRIIPGDITLNGKGFSHLICASVRCAIISVPGWSAAQKMTILFTY
jgi:hypothetical protein